MMNFSERLARAMQTNQSATVVGIDPRAEQLPPPLLPDEPTPQNLAHAYQRFGCEIIDAVADRVAAVKPQMAFFEQLGPLGMAALGEIIRHARRQDLLVILDGKRNDIGSTATAYAHAYLGQQSAWQADALTISPYLGDDSLEPFLEVAKQQDAGLFILVKTSNPGGKTFQDQVADGRPIYRHVAELVERWSADTVSACGFGLAGAVVGATYPQQLEELREAMPHTWFLVPGYGAQGGGAKDVAAAFSPNGLGAVVNSSRAIIFAHARPEYAGVKSWQDAVRAATDDMNQQLREHTSVGTLAKG